MKGSIKVFASLLFAVLFFKAVSIVAFAQAVAQATPAITLSEIEDLKIQNKMKDLTIMQLAYQAKSKELTDLGTNFNSAQADLDTLIATVKKAHGWGEAVVFDKTTGKFVSVPKPAATPSKDAPKK